MTTSMNASLGDSDPRELKGKEAMGGDRQVTIMVLMVNLQCHRCYKKVKNVLCKFPQIQDQVYDEKQNTVTIKVVCCSPGKIKQKIFCQGRGFIKDIKDKEPEKPKPKDEKPKGQEKPKQVPPIPSAPPIQVPYVPARPIPSAPPIPVPYVPAPTIPSAPPIWVPYVPGYPKGQFPMRTCCPDCYKGRPGGPCFYGCGPVGPPPCYQYDGYYGRPVYDSYGGGRSYYASRCDYFSEENPGACATM